MKIAMLTRWGATCGIATHAELIAKEWIKNHQLTVFAPTLNSVKDWYHQVINKPDESWVIRGYEQPTSIGQSGWIDDRLWKNDYDVLVVQGLELMPIPALIKIWEKIKAKKILVVHEKSLPSYEGFYKLKFDAIVCFDERYKSMLSKRYPPDIIHIIPYPCHPIVKGDMKLARKKLGIPGDKIVLFTFGRQPQKEYDDFLRVVEELSKTYNIKYLILRSDNKWDRNIAEFLDIRMGALPIEEIYEYLHAADVHLIPKSHIPMVVVSSTAFQTLGALTPIVAPATQHFEMLNKEIVKYRNIKELKDAIIRLITDEDYKKDILNAAEKYVKENSSKIIAKRFIELFNCL